MTYRLSGSWRTFMFRPAMSQPVPTLNPIRLAAMISSNRDDLIHSVCARLGTEFGVSEGPEALALAQVGEARMRLLALDGRYDPGEWNTLAAHAHRVQALYQDDSGEPEIAVTLLAVSPNQVIHGASNPADKRIYLGEGVFAEIVMVSSASGGLVAVADADPRWSDPDLLNYLNQIAATLAKGD